MLGFESSNHHRKVIHSMVLFHMFEISFIYYKESHLPSPDPLASLSFVLEALQPHHYFPARRNLLAAFLLGAANYTLFWLNMEPQTMFINLLIVQSKTEKQEKTYAN